MNPFAGPPPVLERMGTTPTPEWMSPEGLKALKDLERLPFLAEEYEERRQKVRRLFADAGADALLVFRPSSVEYLCGHHTTEDAPQPLLLTISDTFLYVPQAEVGRAVASSCAGTVVHYSPFEDGLALIVEHVARCVAPLRRVALEVRDRSVPPSILGLLRDARLEVVEGNFFVERVRLVLSPTEISYVEKAAVYTQRGVEAATGAAQSPGATDSSIAAAIRAALAEEANSSAAIDPIVATGPRAGISHSTWNCTPVEKGTTTFVEFAGACHRYHAPVMRTLTHGKPSAIAMRLEELARTTIVTVLDIAQPGVPCTEVARQALDAIGPLEDDIAFHYNFGYPVGLAHPPGWMDGAPFYLVSGNQEPLKEGMVFHLPASFRWFGTVGVGLSQTFVVEAEGARVLTRGPAEVVQV